MSNQITSISSHRCYTTHGATSTSAIRNKRMEASVVSPSSSKKVKGTPSYTKDIIDLTGDTLPVFVIRNTHALYYSYDPRGTNCPSDPCVSMCDMCGCPLIYCSEVVFGNLAAKRAMYIMKQDDIDFYDEDEDVEKVFEKEYTSLVYNKMIWNNINFCRFDVEKINLPMCIIEGSLAQLCKDVVDERVKGPGNIWDGGLDLKKNNNKDKDKGNSVPSVVHTMKTSTNGDEEDNGYTVKNNKELPVIRQENRRTAIEQPADVGPLFKMMKKKLREMTGDL